jgi:hypothetical protein
LKIQFRENNWCIAGIGTLLIILLSALSYLILTHRFGFYQDDWYLVYAGLVEGSGKFFDIFASDRPFRAYLVGYMFDLFGLHAPYYGYVSFVFRVGGSLAMFWLLRLLWPQHKRLMIFLAALFAIYPGWNDQPTGFDYQSHLLSFALIILSLALMVRAWHETGTTRRWIVLTGLAILTQLFSLLLMEYYIGLEGFRLVLLIHLSAGQKPLVLLNRIGREKLHQLIWNWLPYLAGTATFLVWRFFIFENTRSATDVSGMFASIFRSPVYRGLGLLVNLVQDYFNVTLVAWFWPPYEFAFGLRLRDALIALLLGVFAAGLIWIVWLWLQRLPDADADQKSESVEDWRVLIVLGSLAVICSLLPIALGDRHIIFPQYSRFSLPGSIGAVMVIGGILLSIRYEYFRILIIMALAGLAVAANYGNSVVYANNWAAVRDFWWQTSWRIPQIKPETVLAVKYSAGAVVEDYFVWGPANLIYYPESYKLDDMTRTPLSSVVLTKENVLAIRMGFALPDRERRSIVSGQDLGNTLVMSMPTSRSCMHVIDGMAPERSADEDERILLIADQSNLELIVVDAAFHIPPADLFGSEPPHGWCYFYQKASLARQQGHWEEVVQLGNEALAQGKRPLDMVEWFPFVQAYAYLGDYEKVDSIYPIIADDPYLKYQGCELFTKYLLDYQVQFPEGQQYLKDKFCQ